MSDDWLDQAMSDEGYGGDWQRDGDNPPGLATIPEDDYAEGSWQQYDGGGGGWQHDNDREQGGWQQNDWHQESGRQQGDGQQDDWAAARRLEAELEARLGTGHEPFSGAGHRLGNGADDGPFPGTRAKAQPQAPPGLRQPQAQTDPQGDDWRMGQQQDDWHPLDGDWQQGGWQQNDWQMNQQQEAAEPEVPWQPWNLKPRRDRNGREIHYWDEYNHEWNDSIGRPTRPRGSRGAKGPIRPSVHYHAVHNHYQWHDRNHQ
jgi:hypothetical protein